MAVGPRQERLDPWIVLLLVQYDNANLMSAKVILLYQILPPAFYDPCHGHLSSGQFYLDFQHQPRRIF